MADLPSPTGRFAIGTTVRHLVDPTRTDILDGDGHRPRELMVQVWYPARPETGHGTSRMATYISAGRLLEPLEDLMRLPVGSLAHLASVPTHGVPDAALSPDQEVWPVLVFSHGRCGFRGHNTVLVEELASHGYIVATIDHPHAATGVEMPDGREVMFDRRLLPPWPRQVPPGIDRDLMGEVVPFLGRDVTFVIDELARLNHHDADDLFTGRLDMSRLAAFGVSLGGMLAGEASVADPRISACLIMDVYLPQSVVRAGLQIPTMWITRDAGTMCLEGWGRPDIEDTHRSMRSVYERLPGAGYIVLVPGMYHVDFSDGQLLSPLIAERGISGSVPLRSALDIVSSYSRGFFDEHLKGQRSPILHPTQRTDTHVWFESRETAERQFQMPSDTAIMSGVS